MVKYTTLGRTAALYLALLGSAAQASYINELADVRLFSLNVTGAQNGTAMTNLGDINGDGLLDFASTIPGDDLGGTAVAAGSFAIFLGDRTADRPGASSIGRIYGTQAGMALGSSIAGAGDINGDGFDDFIVGAPNFDVGASANVGRAMVYFGQSVGLPSLAGSIGGSQADALYGAAVAGAGDVNGDGYADVLVGAPRYDDAARTDSGQVMLFFGGPGTQIDNTPDAVLSPTAAQSRFGSSLAGVGDFNGDGAADFVVGVPFATVGQSAEGAGLLYLGGNGAFDPNADAAFESNQTGANLGTAVVGAGDVNGDGFADVALGAPSYNNGQTDEGAVYVFHGSAVVNATVDLVIERNITGAALGSALAAADINGDGYADLAIGMPLSTDYSILEFGKVWMSLGSEDGLDTESFEIHGMASSTSGGRFGSALALVDYNGDGYPELFIGAPREQGASSLLQGFPYMVRSGLRLSSAVDQSVLGGQSGAQLGAAVATGDLNGDGLSDMAVGLPNFDTGSQNVGRVELYFGRAGGFNNAADVFLNGGTANARFGRSVAIGDFNRDGYGDVVVGAPEQSSNGGEAHIFYGGAGAFNTSVDRILSIAQVGAGYGETVAAVGDLNADGAVDLAVGAPLADVGASNVGVVYLYFGNAAGIGSAPNVELQGNRAELRQGVSIVGAGDVNGDGIGDLAVGVRDAGANVGGVRIWFGATTFDTGVDQTLADGTTGALCGAGLAAAGDVNGDGYSDLLIGCPTASFTQGTLGSVQLFRGSSSGLDSNALWSDVGPAPGSQFGFAVAGGSDLDGDGFADIAIGMPGASLNNGSGNGGIRWYRGGLNGPIGTSAMESEVPVNFARFGASLAMSDNNGDGFAELISGAPGIASTAADVGAWHLIHAHTLGRNGSAQQFRNATTPVDFQGGAQSDGFFAVLDGLSPRGRERARLRVQACPSGVAFGHTSCRESSTANWQDLSAQVGSVILVANPTGLSDGKLYRWRARLLYAPIGVTQPGISAPANPASVGPWRRMRATADVVDIRAQDGLLRNGFE